MNNTREYTDEESKITDGLRSRLRSNIKTHSQVQVDSENWWNVLLQTSTSCLQRRYFLCPVCWSRPINEPGKYSVVAPFLFTSCCFVGVQVVRRLSDRMKIVLGHLSLAEHCQSAAATGSWLWVVSEVPRMYPNHSHLPCLNLALRLFCCWNPNAREEFSSQGTRLHAGYKV